jgi:hypothetical protein
LSKRSNGKKTATKTAGEGNVSSGMKRVNLSDQILPLTQHTPKKQKTEAALVADSKPASNDAVKVVPYELLLKMRRTIIDSTDDKKGARGATRWIVTLGKDHGVGDGSIDKQYLSRKQNRETYNRNIDDMLAFFKSCVGGAGAGWISDEEMV